MGDRALVIGNGESRSVVDLLAFRNFITVGCNALHRDFTTDHLVCCDARMVREALENPNTKSSHIHVRDTWHHYFRKIQKNKNIKLVPDIPYQGDARPDKAIHWGSGPYAVLVATTLGVDEIWLLGFDLYGVNHLVNNVYKDTANYKASQTAAVDPSYWVYQIGKIIQLHPNIEFNILNTDRWIMPKEWEHTNSKKVSLDVALELNILYT